ncbi:MAG: cohesin domain-containing protein, partial [Candidatus Marinimicrobia bacterium]|nr:cohesin domain-containing protein [Candidatus Neomarinimicrobiota bacterium]
SISIFSLLKALGLTLVILCFSCEDAEYELDNPFDPSNIDLDPPALFFHPPEISANIGDPISVELYGLKLDPAAAAHLDIRYDWGSVTVDSVVPGPFFTGENTPMEVTVDEQGILDVFIYYLPDMDSDQSQGGTWSIATVYFSTISTGESELLYGPNTTLRDENNALVTINDYGSGYINVE